MSGSTPASIGRSPGPWAPDARDSSRSPLRLPDPTLPLPPRPHELVAARFSRLCADRGDRPAVVDAEGIWSYGRLETLSNQLAHLLRQAGVGAGDLVAIYADRAESLVWALLAVWKAGGAFVILDPAYPPSRTLDTLRVAKPRAWIALESSSPVPRALEQFLSSAEYLLRLELPARSESPGRWSEFPAEAAPWRVRPGDLAYAAFTSGSSGKPKGILGTHAPISHFLQWHAQEFGLADTDRFSLLSGLSHDPLIRDVFAPLWVGATLHVPRPEDIAPGRMTEWLRERAITIVRSARSTARGYRYATRGR